jgi:hypothetical protein
MTFWLRSTLVCGGLLLAGSGAFAQGEYQQTKDGKTVIWNGTPKPGEAVTWDGDRDKENYATGFGALTWYTAKGSVYGLYYGNMVHGKLEGPVNVHTNGRTAHAYFVDGGRVTTWARGPAPSKMAVPEEVVAEKRKVQAEREAAAAKKEAEKRLAAAAEAEKKAKVEREKARAAEEAAAKAETTPAETQKSEVSSAEKPATEAVKKEPEPTVAERQSEAPATSNPTRTFDEPTPIPTKSEISSTTERPPPALERPVTESTPPPIQETPPAVQESPPETKSEVVAQTPEITRESAPAPTKKESAADVSLNSLVGPPSSLRTTTETSAPKTENETSTSRGNAPVTEAEAISLADTEARQEGAHLDDYERPKVDHSAVKGKWSLFYGLKEGRSAAESGGPFTVTVEDKTKKVEIRK